MTTISKPYSQISLAECVDLIASVGDKVTVFAQGHIGTGKSSMLKMLGKRFPDHHLCYLDCTTLDVGDLSVPKVKTIDGVEVTAFVPNESLGFHQTKPVILMADEISKGTQAVKKALLRIMLERAQGVNVLPEGSIVFATGNLALEGVSDMLEAHARNRLCVVKVRKPTAMEWVEQYALNNNIEPVVIGTVIEFPSMLESFENVEDPSNNQYIHHPKSPRAAFVTPRSLEKASDILKATRALPDDVRVHALCGVIGEPAAMDMMTMVKLDADLPTWERIMADPENTPTPKSGVASCMIIAKAAMRIDKECFGKWMTYLDRMPKEAQALFARTIMRGEKKGIAASFGPFTDWARQNMYLFS